MANFGRVEVSVWAPVVSIVTPTYNQAAYLAETIESVLTQDYPAVDYRVINDGSTDDTEKVLSQYAGCLIAENQANEGQTATINTGWRKSRGEILAWLNSDDTLLPGAVQTAVEFLLEHKDVDIVYGTTIFTDENVGRAAVQRHGAHPFDYLTFVRLCENPIPQPSAFIRRRVVENVGLLDTHFYYFMDWDYWLRAGLRHTIVGVAAPLSTYRLHGAAKSIAGLGRAAPELEYMYRKFFETQGLPSQIRAVRKEAVANMYITSGGYFLSGGLSWRAALCGLLAAKTNPSLLVSITGLHKVLYCIAGRSAAYRALRRVIGRKQAQWPGS